MRLYMLVMVLLSSCLCQAHADQPNAACKASALKTLQMKAPEEYRIFNLLNDKDLFFFWLKCHDLQLELATAVHESVHVITGERNSFPLVDGEDLRLPGDTAKMFPPKKMSDLARKEFGEDDAFVQNYILPGEQSASSAEDFLYLLDELNAYAHDLNVASRLASLSDASATSHAEHREGLAAMMAFTVQYVSIASRSNQISWDPQLASAVNVLLKQGEDVLRASCTVPNLGKEGEQYVKYYCSPTLTKSLEAMLGRAPSCEHECFTGG